MSIKHNKAQASSFYTSNCIAKETQSCTRISTACLLSAVIFLIDMHTNFNMENPSN